MMGERKSWKHGALLEKINSTPGLIKNQPKSVVPSVSATTSQNFLSPTLVFTAVYICAGTSCLPTNTNIKMQEG